MIDAKLEKLLREAVSEEPPETCNAAIVAEIRQEAARRRRRALVLRWARSAAAVLVLAMLIIAPSRLRHHAAVMEDNAGDGDIMLEIIGFASLGDFYAEEE